MWEDPRSPVSLRCLSCGEIRSFRIKDVMRILRTWGLLRRDESPDFELVRELFMARLADLACEACGAQRWAVDREEEADDDWGDAVTCEICRTPIPAERLAVFPASRRCVSCQQGDEQGTLREQREFCSHCGSVLEMRARTRRGSGLAAYALVCPACGRS
jgi:hypothetical protein